MKWTKSEINHIKVSLARCNAEDLANELGRAEENVKRKIREIGEKQRLAKIAQSVKQKAK